MPPKLRLYLWPTFTKEDKGDGGIRRVVEAQRRYLPSQQGVEIVADPGDADVIAAHISLPDEYLKRFPDKPLVTHCHGLYWSEYEWEQWAYKANRDILRSFAVSDVITAPSEWVAQVIRRHSLRDVRPVPHGINLREWQPAPEHRGYVLWNKTRIDPVCDPRPASQLAKAMPETPFLLTYGDERLQNVRTTGKTTYEQGKALVRHAGVYLATTCETFGIGTLEAMAAGVPIVAYNVGGQREILTHGVDSWLVEEGDIDGLAEGVRWALANRETVGKAARESARRYPWSTPIRMYKDIYSEVVERYEQREQSPRVSIIVPAYELDAYLDEALASVEAQTDGDWECIVVDDASPDRCGAIADAWAEKDQRFRAIHNAENLHASGARNAGIAEARGRYIMALDADDRLDRRAVQVLADALDSDRTLAGAYGSVRFYEEDGQTPSLYGPQYDPGMSGWPPMFNARDQLAGSNHVPYNLMYRHEAWTLTGGYRRRYRTAEDADFWNRMTSYGFRIEQVTGAPLLHYRNRLGSLSRREAARRHDYIGWYPWARSENGGTPAMMAGPKHISLLNPKVTVVIPVGPGHEQLAIDAVDSVVAQTYPYWEVVVVNDTGGPLPYLPPFVREVACSARDTGASRNLGVAAARTALFLPLDADDYLQPQALERLMAAEAEVPGTIVYPDFYQDPREENQFTPYTLPDPDCTWLTKKGLMHTITALTPVAVWREVGGYVENRNWEDWDFQLRCAAHGACSVHVPEPLFTYRKWTGKRREFDDQGRLLRGEIRKEEIARRRDALLADWSPYFTGEKTLAGCGCNGKSVWKTPSPSTNGSQSRVVRSSANAVLVEYTGNKSGKMSFRGVSGTVYAFSRDTGPRWVLGTDVDGFLNRPDFAVAASPSSEVLTTA